MREVSFAYRNHRGELETRRVVPEAIEFHANPGYNYQPGWFLTGYDLDRQAVRSFALSHMILEEPEALEIMRGPQKRLSLKLEG